MFKKIVWLWFSSKWKKAKDVNSYIDSLVGWWATEFFTGYTPSYWSDKFGFEVSPNGRFAEHEQITDIGTLKAIVERVHYHKLEIFINLNARYYSDITFPLIEKMLKEFEDLKIDWIICWNIGILEYLKDIWYKWKINISTIMALYNTESIRFFIENYDINKIILSREVTLKEIENVVTSFPETKFEVFWEWDFCRYNNGLCFAEHKYWSKDICSVVVNDLIIKKRFRPDFKKLILNNDISVFDKLKLLDNQYSDNFTKIQNILDNVELWLNENKENSSLELLELINKIKNNTDLYYDGLKSFFDENNKKVIICLKALKYILTLPPAALLRGEGSLLGEFKKLGEELEKSIKSWMEFYNQKLKELSWKTNIQALEKKEFYSRSWDLNLYSYLFFAKFKNIETVKFPMRWRVATEKLQNIEKVVRSWKIDESIFDRSIWLDRIHYDLTYIFWDKLWFRNMLGK